ncbi:MAG TPA: glutathione synthase [Azospirillaceae bacterium]|nr:glutathione synthase [Azospirillaceae bacterium]HRQ82299.1 glutathione synthase [Azospirillaceae bacterium]
MSLTVAFQMDPIESINIDTDSSFMLALEAQARGHTLLHYHPRDLSFSGARLTARARPMTVRRVKGDHYALGEERVVDLATVDVILMRQDPPFDLAYITATHMLEHVADRVLVMNDPAEVRNAPEKIFVTRFPDLMPPTVITSDRRAVQEFRAEHQDIIVKPLFGNGGAGVFHLKPGDENLGSLLELFGEMYREPLIVQRYLPEVRQGDKRIILVDGKPAGAVSRMPQDGEARANFHAGGSAKQADLTAREEEICAKIGPELSKRGLVFVGIDVIGDFLTEINVTSPTGIQEINRLSGTKIEALLWDAFERRRAAQVKG